MLLKGEGQDMTRARFFLGQSSNGVRVDSLNIYLC
jgi:hypothetical protein